MNNKNLELKNILNTVNDEKNYEKLLLALEILSEKSNTFKKLLVRQLIILLFLLLMLFMVKIHQ